jgi:hypothetical protein
VRVLACIGERTLGEGVASGFDCGRFATALSPNGFVDRNPIRSV